jgi:hypothetical protein
MLVEWTSNRPITMMGHLVHNTSIEHRRKVYSMHVLFSFIFGATSWYLASL